MNNKLATTTAPIERLLAARWSPRAFDASLPVSKEIVRSLLEAARWAPSCFNEQPWRYLVFNRADNEIAWNQALACLVEGNRDWAQAAPVLLIAVAMLEFAASGKTNRWAQYDTGAASENLCLQGSAMGLAVHQMGGFNVDAVRDAFALPDNCMPMAVIAVGFPGQTAKLPAKIRDKEVADRVRRDIEEFSFSNTWREPFDVAAGA